MISIHPQYIKDSNGKNSLVVIPAKEFAVIMEELEELEDIRHYDKAKKKDNGERIPMDEAFRLVEAKRNNK